MRIPWPLILAAGLAASCATVEREPPATGQKAATDLYEVPPGPGPAYSPEVTTPVKAWMSWAVAAAGEPSTLTLGAVRAGMQRFVPAMRALETTEAELRDELRARTERFSVASRWVAEPGGGAREVRGTLIAATDLIEELAKGRMTTNPDLREQITAAKRAAAAIDPERPLDAQRDALAAAFQATVEPMAAVANVLPPVPKEPDEAPLPLPGPEESPAVPR